MTWADFARLHPGPADEIRILCGRDDELAARVFARLTSPSRRIRDRGARHLAAAWGGSPRVCRYAADQILAGTEPDLAAYARLHGSERASLGPSTPTDPRKAN